MMRMNQQFPCEKSDYELLLIAASDLDLWLALCLYSRGENLSEPQPLRRHHLLPPCREPHGEPQGQAAVSIRVNKTPAAVTLPGRDCGLKPASAKVWFSMLENKFLRF